MAGRRAKPAPIADQRELDFTRPPTPAKPARIPTDIDQAERFATRAPSHASGNQREGVAPPTIFPTRDEAERLLARAIREQTNPEAVMAEAIEAAE